MMRSTPIIDLLTLRHLPSVWKDSPGAAIMITVVSLATIHGPIAALIWMALKA